MPTFLAKRFVFLLPLVLLLLMLPEPSLAATIAPVCNAPTPTTTSGAGSPGYNLLASVFTTIQTVMNAVSGSMYTAIVGPRSLFQIVMKAVLLLYIVIYGVMITFNLASYKPADITNRLIKIALFYALLSPSGWDFFSQEIGIPLINSMNELIGDFASAASISTYTPPAPLTPGASGHGPTDLTNASLNVGSIVFLTNSITQIFSDKFFIAILSIWTLPWQGWVMEVFLIWGLIDFILMVIGAVATYIKSIIGIAFLFGVAPIFLVMLLFDKTRQIFFGWLNQLISFLIQPVLLFGFLAYYMTLLDNAINIMLPTTLQFCWLKWFDLLGAVWEISWWRPVQTITGTPSMGGGDWHGALPISMPAILYFLMICHLGKSFGRYIEVLSRDISEGMGPGMTSGGQVGAWFRNNLNNSGVTGSVGRGAVGVAAGISALAARRIDAYRRNRDNPGNVSRDNLMRLNAVDDTLTLAKTKSGSERLRMEAGAMETAREILGNRANRSMVANAAGQYKMELAKDKALELGDKLASDPAYKAMGTNELAANLRNELQALPPADPVRPGVKPVDTAAPLKEVILQAISERVGRDVSEKELNRLADKHEY